MRHRARTGLKSRRNFRQWRRLRREAACSWSLERKADKSDGVDAKDGFFRMYLLVLSAGCSYLMQLLLQLNRYAAVAAFFFLIAYAIAASRLQQAQKRQELRLSEASIYMDTILYAFLKEGKIDAALSDVQLALSDGEMKEKVKEALLHMRQTFDDSQILRDGLRIIEDAYPTRRLVSIHMFMLHVEDYGGEYQKPARLLLKDKELWEKRIRFSIAERRKMFREVVLSVITSLVICGIVQYIPVMNMETGKNPVVQLGSLFVLGLDLVILLRAQRYLAADWLKYDENCEEEENEQRMLRFRSYDENRARIPSMIFGSLALLGCLVFIWHGKKLAAAAAVLAAMVLFGQHRIGQALLTRQLKEEIKRAFPNWLLDLVLLLQSENVQMALQKSLYTVSGVLRFELQELLERLRVSPEDAAPYHRFLQEFEIPEIQSAMSMLYAISAGHGGDAERQIEELVNRSQEMLSEAEKQKNADRNAGLYLLFLAPVITASIKMLIDLSVFMLAFLLMQTG